MPRQLPAFSLLTNEVVDRMSHLFFFFSDDSMKRGWVVCLPCFKAVILCRRVGDIM